MERDRKHFVQYKYLTEYWVVQSVSAWYRKEKYVQKMCAQNLKENNNLKKAPNTLKERVGGVGKKGSMLCKGRSSDIPNDIDYHKLPFLTRCFHIGL